jgi:CO/xanthine dehydrogenase FAD-binding subunit
VKSALSELVVVRPRSLDHALRALHESLADGRLTPLAGGTDLFVYLNAGTCPDRRFLDLAPLRELAGIRVGRDGVTIGSSTTFRAIRDHLVLGRRWPALVAAAAEVGAWQIQNRATIGGNIANASPAGDSLPVLLAHDAVVHARSVRGERAVPFGALYTGYRKLALEPDELITAVEIPPAPAGTVPFFRKIGTRRAQSISKVVFCGLLRLGRDGRADHARLAYGSVAPTPVRARHAEAALLGQGPSRAVAERARQALERDVVPIDDIRSTREYRVAVAGNVLEQFLRTADPRFA